MFKLAQKVLGNSVQKTVRFKYFSSTAAPTVKILKTNNNNNTSQENSESEDISKSNNVTNKSKLNNKSSNTMVAAAFASLTTEGISSNIQTTFTDEKLTKAKTIDEILSLSVGNGVSRRYALKAVSILADWCSSGKVKLIDFESDPRFIRLCKTLTKGTAYASPKNPRKNILSQSEDLSTILSVTADDEAAKLVSSITTSQMVKVMTTLSQKRRRSTTLLRALSYNITKSQEQLDLKQCADLLYGMSTLNFPDETLLTRIGNDICVELEKELTKSTVIGSIITSLGLLRYKNVGLLDVLSEWILKNHLICRTQDIFSLFLTMAVLNYIPINSERLYKILIPQLNQSEAGKPTVWIDFVWSLTVLNQATPDHISSILISDFIKNLEDNTSPSTKLKLLNVDAAAEFLVKDYEGPRLEPDFYIKNVKVSQTKEKIEMVDSILDSLKNLIQSEDYLRTNIYSRYGYFIDAECLLDKKCTPRPLALTNASKDTVRVAILAHDYHDICRGRLEPTGFNILIMNLLKKQGYKVLTVPHTEYKVQDKLVHKVQYLENKLKEIVKS